MSAEERMPTAAELEIGKVRGEEFWHGVKKANSD